MATAAPPVKRVYLYRLLTLTIDQGNIVVRNIFDEAIGNIPLHQFLAQEMNAINRLKENKVITKVQYDTLFPPSGNPPTTADFDLTLAVCLLRNLKACNLNTNFKWNALPQSADTSLEADIRRLQMFRNKLAHISTTNGMNQTEFTQEWMETEKVLNRLNSKLRLPIPYLQQDIIDCKNEPLDPDTQEHLEKHIDNMKSSLEILENKFQDLREDVTTGFSDMSKRMDEFQEQKKSEEKPKKSNNFIQNMFSKWIYKRKKKHLIRKNKRNMDKLLSEMIALTRRSSLPESLRPVISGSETRKLSRQVAEGLFEIDQTIKYRGYRYRTLHIKVELIPHLEKKQHRNDKIETFLSRNGITDYRLDENEGRIKEYVCAGDEIQSEDQNKATLGCISMYTKGERKSFCGLISKHLLQGSSKIFVDGGNTHFGTVIPNTNNQDDGHDISAAEIVEAQTKHLDPRFRNFENIKPAYVFDNVDIGSLQDQPVYLRGAKPKLGIGTIHIPGLNCCDGNTFVQLIDGNYTLGKPDGKLAIPGDSGSIICMDDSDSNRICLLSMVMGELCHNNITEKEYMSLRLSCGLNHLEEITQGKFSIEEAMIDKETGNEC